MGPGVKKQLFVEKIKYFVDDSVKSIQFSLSNGNTSMMYGTSFPANKQIKLGPEMKSLARITVNYRSDRRGVYGLTFYARNGSTIAAIVGKDLTDTTVEHFDIPENKRFLGCITSCQISAVDGKSFMKGIIFVCVDL